MILTKHLMLNLQSWTVFIAWCYGHMMVSTTKLLKFDTLVQRGRLQAAVTAFRSSASLSEPLTTMGKSLAMAALPLRHGNKEDASGHLMQPKCTAQPSPNFLSKDSGNLVVPVPDTVPNHGLLSCPIFHNTTFFQG